MQLVGSHVSPYVRRTRLFLNHIGTDYEFIDLNIYSPEGRSELEKFTPAMKVPVLKDGDNTLYDSRVISRYLTQKFQITPPSWEEENLLSLVDAVNDSFIVYIMSSRSGIDTSQDILLLNLQRDRLERTMPLLNSAVEEGAFEEWNYLSISLFCCLDWVIFRELGSLEAYPALQQFWNTHHQRAEVASTDPRI